MMIIVLNIGTNTKTYVSSKGSVCANAALYSARYDIPNVRIVIFVKNVS